MLSQLHSCFDCNCIFMFNGRFDTLFNRFYSLLLITYEYGFLEFFILHFDRNLAVLGGLGICCFECMLSILSFFFPLVCSFRSQR